MTQTPNTTQDPASPEASFVIGGPVNAEGLGDQATGLPITEVEPTVEPIQPVVEQSLVEAPQPEQPFIVENPIEQPAAPEQAPTEAPPTPVEVAPAPVAEVTKPAVEAVPQPVVVEKSEEEKRIDEILSDKLGDAVALLEEKVKARFIAKGNETVKAVAQILFTPKMTEHDLLKLVEGWFDEAQGLDAHYLKLLSCFSKKGLPLVLQNDRSTLTTADTKCCKTKLNVSSFHFFGRRQGNTSPCHTDWMPERNRSTIHIKNLITDFTHFSS